MTAGQQLRARQQATVEITPGDPVMRPRDDGLTIPAPPGGWMVGRDEAISSQGNT